MRTVWILCMIRLLFYAAALPLWEGYDEWGHFAVIRAVALEGRVVPDRKAPVQRDLQASLELAPVPWSLNNMPAPSVTQDVFWQVPASARAERERALRTVPSGWMRESATNGLTQL